MTVGGPRPPRASPSALALAAGGVLGRRSGADGEDQAGEDTAAGSQAATTTTVNTGGIEVAAPEGWTADPGARPGHGPGGAPGLGGDAAVARGPGHPGRRLARRCPASPTWPTPPRPTAGWSTPPGRTRPAGSATWWCGRRRRRAWRRPTTLAYAAQLDRGQRGTDPATVRMVDGAQYPTAPGPVHGGRRRRRGGGIGRGDRRGGGRPGDVLWEVTVTSDDASPPDDRAWSRPIRQTLTCQRPGRDPALERGQPLRRTPAG